MDRIYCKIKQRTAEKDKFRQILSTDDMIFPDIGGLLLNEVKYSPDTLLDDDDWFYLPEFSDEDYCIIPIKEKMNGMDYDLLSSEEFCNIDYIFVIRNQDFLFQNITKSRLIARKRILHIGDDYRYDENNKSLQINSMPDAIYRFENNTLYFKRLEAITNIFKGISDLYKEATDKETEIFLHSDFIKLENGFNSNNVKKSNRKKIAIAINVLDGLNNKDRKRIFNYIAEYCPSLACDKNRFRISDENELSNLLYGIEQKFYTTPVGKEKRLANSVIAL